MQQTPLPTNFYLGEQMINRHPLTVPPRTSLVDVINLMNQSENKDSDCVLVIADSQPIGIFTAKDVVRVIGTETDLKKTVVADSMSQPLVTYKATDVEDITTAVRLLHQHNTQHLTIINNQNCLVGLITLSSLQLHIEAAFKDLQQASTPQATQPQHQAAIDDRESDRSSVTCFDAQQPSDLRKVNEQLQREIAERKRMEQVLHENQSHLRLINSISTQITSVTSAEQAIEITIKQLSQYFKTLRVVYYKIDDESRLFAICSAEPFNMVHLTPDDEIHLSAVAPAFLNTLRQFVPVIIEDINQHEIIAPIKKCLLSEGTQALLDIPLQQSKKLVGILSFESSTPYVWSNHEITTLIEVADYLSLRLQEAYAQQERERIEEALMQSQRVNELLATALENAGDAIEITDAKGLIEYINPAWEEITGYTQAEALGQNSMSLLRSGKHDPSFYQAIEDSLAEGQVWRGNLLARCKNGALCHQEATISPVFNAVGQIEHYVAVKRDVTDRKRVEESLRLTQFSLDHAVDAAFWIRPDGGFIYVNRAACRSLNYSYVELLLLSIRDITPCFSTDDWLECWQNLKQQKSLSFESHHQTKQGKLFPVDVTINYLEFNGREYGFAFARDATRRRQAEEALRLRDQAINASGSGVVIVDARSTDLPIISVNPAFERLTGYSSVDVLGKNCRFLQGDDRDQKAIAELKTAIYSRQECTVTLRNYRKDGTVFWNELSIAPIYDPKGNLTHFVGIQKDVSDRREVEHALRRQLTAIEATTDGIAILNQAEEYTYLNKAHVALLGYNNAAELIGKQWESIYPPNEIQRFKQQLFPILRQTGHWRGEAIAKRKDGSTFPEEISLTLIDGGGMICVCQDITERKQAEEQMRSSLHEKELLLKEVHHRVKNNLQVISSIFSLQAQHVSDPDTLSILSESQNRIRSMALIHEKLYQSNSLAKIDFADYIQSLVKNLFSSYSVSSNLIRLNLNISDVALTLDTAIPCGLLINELVSNSLKHAFPNQRSGQIDVNFSINDRSQLHLAVEDDGIGLPDGWDIQQTSSLGLRLVRALTRQLSGKLDIQSCQGTLFQITFPKPIERKSF